MICPACKNQISTTVGTKNGYALEECKKCGTIFAHVNLTDEETADKVRDLYEHYYDFANYQLPRAAEVSLQKIVESFAAFRQTGNFLDIGFGEGGMLSVAEKNNWKCFGTELSPQSLKYGAEKGWTVSDDAFSDDRFPKTGFDVVTMIELIEHVPNPDSFFGTAFKLLRPNGLLFLTTPNVNSLNCRWLGTDWSNIAPPEHITIWSPNGMRNALQRNGFMLSKIKTEGFNPIEIIGKYRSTAKADGTPIHRNEAAFALNDAFMSSPWRQAVKSTINRGLSLLKLGDGIKIWAVKDNGTNGK